MNKIIYIPLLIILLLTGAVNANEPITPLVTPPYDKEKAKLGEILFIEPRLSGSNKMSCASCHDITQGGGGADLDKQYSAGANDLTLDINTPTILTAALNFKQFWDGRAETLKEQVTGVITNPKEMNAKWEEVVSKLNKDSFYLEQFKKAYNELPSKDNISDALAQYQSSLARPSRFDQYLEGDEGALTDEEKEGYQKFKKYGCIACHQGMNVGGNMFQSFGILGNYFEDRGNITKVDYGRFNITGKEQDRHVFKVPSLRNVALTAPYFHDGSADTLEDAVNVMFKFQLGRPAPDEDKRLIIEFLKTLNSIYD